jgi:hypothetical protein
MSDEALVPVEEPTWKVASSLESSQVGEVMLLDRRGHVLSPRQSRAWTVWGWMRLGLLGGAVAIGSAALFGSGLAGVICAGAFAVPVAWQLRLQQPLKRALALAAAGRREEARAAFEAIERRNPPAGFRPGIDTQLGGVLWLLGDHAAALERYNRAIDAYRRVRKHKSHPGYWVCAFNRVQLLCCMGDVERAEKMARELRDAPDGEYFQMEHMLTELLLAFHADDPDRLTADLYDWSRDALSTNRLGLAVVILAWAFDHRDDPDMRDHLISEAPERLEATFLEDSAPRVHAWMQSQQP